MSDCGYCELMPSSDVLMKIIKAQTQIVEIGHEIGCVMNQVVQNAMELTGSNGATIELAENDEMVYRAVAGNLEPFLGFKILSEGSLSGLCVKTGQILYSEDTQNDPRVDRAAAHKVGAESMVVVPLQYGEHNIGVLKVTSTQKHFYADHAICVLSIMAETMGAAMYHSGEYSIDELLARATTDEMTGVGNRASFYEKLRLLFSKPTSVGILMMDMDGLKTINDTYGHRAGDEAIKEFVERIKANARVQDIIARLGGDEFGMILTSMSNNESIEEIIDRFERAFEIPLIFEGNPLIIGASIGHAIYPDEAEDTLNLIDLADQRMYLKKQLRKNNK